jgi:carbamoyl-phosphate synthase large subunit
MASDRPNALVMAVGSPLGQSILKALQLSDAVGRIHVSDIDDLAAGLYLGADEVVILPMVADACYGDVLRDYIREFDIRVVFPVITPEHEFFEMHLNDFRALGVHIITSGPGVFALCNDKLESMKFLRTRALAAPNTALCEAGSALDSFLESTSFPVFVKPRFGASSQGAVRVVSEGVLNGLVASAAPGSLIVQEYLPDEREFTVGVYVGRNAPFCGSIVIQRDLKFGLSYRGRVLVDDVISEYAERVAKEVGAIHAINVQLKMREGAPTCFEINPRLSSTTSVRAHFGFNEPHLAVLDVQGKLEDSPIEVRLGRFTRYWQEHYLESR